MNLTIELLRQFCILLDEQGAPLNHEIELSKDAFLKLKEEIDIIMENGMSYQSGSNKDIKQNVIGVTLDGYIFIFKEKIN